MICNLIRYLRNKALDLAFGSEEDFDYISVTQDEDIGS